MGNGISAGKFIKSAIPSFITGPCVCTAAPGANRAQAYITHITHDSSTFHYPARNHKPKPGMNLSSRKVWECVRGHDLSSTSSLPDKATYESAAMLLLLLLFDVFVSSTREFGPAPQALDGF
uniref:Uncharacterized protein n=1 Tax=Anopheles coluzzii TaxID=1518534 RepID=A0A8W7PVA7_ANOCL